MVDYTKILINLTKFETTRIIIEYSSKEVKSFLVNHECKLHVQSKRRSRPAPTSLHSQKQLSRAKWKYWTDPPQYRRTSYYCLHWIWPYNPSLEYCQYCERCCKYEKLYPISVIVSIKLWPDRHKTKMTNPCKHQSEAKYYFNFVFKLIYLIYLAIK